MATGRPFQNDAVDVQGWYVVCSSRDLPRDARKPVSFPWLRRRVVVWRDATGAPRVADARCPHLGADLGHGRVVEGHLQCAVHGWRFQTSGACVHAPGQEGHVPTRALRTFAAVERWGLVWAFHGPEPLFPLPSIASTGAGGEFAAFVLRGPPKACHPHVVTANGLDAVHFEQLHAFDFATPPRLERLDAYSLRVHLHGHPRPPPWRFLTGTRRTEMRGTFTTYGANLSEVAIAHPFRFHFLMAGRPCALGTPSAGTRGTETHTVLFFPKARPASVVSALALVVHLFKDDTRILEHFQLQEGFTPSDAPVKAFVDLVNALPTW